MCAFIGRIGICHSDRSACHILETEGSFMIGKRYEISSGVARFLWGGNTQVAPKRCETFWYIESSGPSDPRQWIENGCIV